MPLMSGSQRFGLSSLTQSQVCFALSVRKSTFRGPLLPRVLATTFDATSSTRVERQPSAIMSSTFEQNRLRYDRENNTSGASVDFPTQWLISAQRLAQGVPFPVVRALGRLRAALAGVDVDVARPVSFLDEARALGLPSARAEEPSSNEHQDFARAAPHLLPFTNSPSMKTPFCPLLSMLTVRPLFLMKTSLRSVDVEACVKINH